jgi:response regulator RpfG family c-di-GMP phosphodiesterase
MFYLAVEKTKPELCDRFIFITGFADNPKVSQFLAKTKAQVLIKPVNTEDLLQAIAIVLRRNSG